MGKLWAEAATYSHSHSGVSVRTRPHGLLRTPSRNSATGGRAAFRRLSGPLVFSTVLLLAPSANAQNQSANFQEFAGLAVDGLQTFAHVCPDCTGEPFTSDNWHNANALEALMDYAVASGNTAPNVPAWFLSAAAQSGVLYHDDPQFPFRAGGTNDGQNDDALWWALAFIRSYDATGDVAYLRDAEGIFAQVTNWWGDAFQSGIDCGGGVAWQQVFAPPPSYPAKTGGYDNAVTNELFLETAIRLHLRFCSTGQEPWCNTAPTTSATPNGRTYLAWANFEFAWFEEGRKSKADPMGKRIPGPSACHRPFGS